MSEILREGEGMRPEKAGMFAMLQSIGRLFGGGRGRNGGEYVDDADKPVTVRVCGDGVVYVNSAELMRSNRVQDQLAKFGKLFREKKPHDHGTAINLTGECADFVDKMVANGTYASANEVVSAGVSALRERNNAIEHWLHEEVAPAYDEFMKNPKRTRSAQAVFKDLRERHKKAKEGSE